MSPTRVARLLVVALLAVACGAGRPEIASVGDRDVAQTDLTRSVALQRVLADLQGSPCGRPDEGESQRSACDRLALSAELLWLAVADYAEDHDLVADAADVDAAVSDLETQVGEEELGRALEARGVTREDLTELGRRILTIRAVRGAVAEESIGEEELRAQYDERLNEFTTVQANHILVESRAEADRVYERIRDANEQEFVAEAKRTSTEPGAAERGGRLGSAVASTYTPRFADAVVALEPGEISQPVRTEFGWHVIYLVDKDVTSFEDAKSRILEPLADDEFRAWLEERADELGVEVDPRFGRSHPSTFSVTPSRSTDPDAGSASPATTP